MAANHQLALNFAKTEWVWRLDDDNVCEPNVLETLLSHSDDYKVGAVGNCVWVPGGTDGSTRTNAFSNKIADIFAKPNLQWCKFDTPEEVDHLHCSFLYRRRAATHGFCTDLKTIREETTFTYEMKRAGWKILVDPRAIIWHLRCPRGGIRVYDNNEFVENERIFSEKLKSWNITPNKYKVCALIDCGIGDHLIFKSVLDDIKKGNSEHKILVAPTYPDVFKDVDAEIIGTDNICYFNVSRQDCDIYAYCRDRKISIADGFKQMYIKQ